MSLVAIVAGLYYTVGTGYLLSSWLGSDKDYARPNDPRPTEDVSGDYGFLKFQAGLITDQIVDELTWSTRVPFEFKMVRNASYWEQHPDEDHDVEMALRIRWKDASGINEEIKDSFIPMIGQKGFMRVDIQDMYPRNVQNSGTIELKPSPNGPITKHPVPTDHPTFFDVIQPRDMTFGALEDIELYWRTKLYPRGGTTWKSLRNWFDPDDPEGVQLRTIKTEDTQEIRYDYW